jgi:hypothetical protein
MKGVSHELRLNHVAAPAAHGGNPVCRSLGVADGGALRRPSAEANHRAAAKAKSLQASLMKRGRGQCLRMHEARQADPRGGLASQAGNQSVTGLASLRGNRMQRGGKVLIGTWEVLYGAAEGTPRQPPRGINNSVEVRIRKSEGLVVPLNPVKAGGGKEPWPVAADSESRTS